MSGNFMDTVANAMLDKLLGTSGVLGGTVYVGLLVSKPSASDGTGAVEPATADGYARVAVTNDATNWPAAASRQKTHSADIVFPAASGSGWGTVVAAAIFAAASGGAPLLVADLDQTRTIQATDVFKFIAGSSGLKFTFPFS